METTGIETETVPSILLPCTSCSRTFRPEALAKHSKVCEKILMRKRKQFDSSKQRLQGTEIETFVPQTVPKTSRKKEAQLNLSKSKWKEKVEQVRVIQAVKKPTETPLSSQVVKPSDHEECPYCGRSFGPKAFERHTEFCKEQLHKLKVSNNINSEARERLKVRTTYRGPLTNKVLNRDRYQPNRNRDPSPLGLSSSEIYVADETPKSRGLSRNSSLRSSLRSKPETTPPPPLRRTMTQINPPSKGPRGSPKDINETDLLQKTQSFNNKPRMISKEPIEKRMKPTNSKSIAQPSSKTAGSHPKSPPKLNNTDVNTFKELNVISCFTSGSSKSDNNLKLLNNHHSSVVDQGAINSETSLKDIYKNENSTPDSLKADDLSKPINDQYLSDVVQETIKPETSSNVVPKTEIEEIMPSEEDLNLENPSQPINEMKINPTPRNSKPLTEEINKQTDLTKSCNKNMAFTIEFEPDNRFLVYEHHKVGLKKSPLICKKRISKSYESVKSFINKDSNFEDIEIKSNIISESEEPPINKNLLVVNKEESSAPNVTQNCAVKTTETDELILSNLSWRERVLEIMEVSDSPGDKNLNTLPKKNPDQIELYPVSGSKSVESQFEIVEKTNKSNSNDKFTDTDSSLLINQELVDIFSPKQKTLDNFIDACLHNDGIVHEKNMRKSVQVIQDLEETMLIDEKNKNSQNVESSDEVGTFRNSQDVERSDEVGTFRNSQDVERSDEVGTLPNDFLDADLYFAEENNDEIVKMQSDGSLDVDMYFVEENNIANEVMREETSNMVEIVEAEQSAKESNESNLFTGFDNKNVGNVMKTNNLVDPIEVHDMIIAINYNSPYLNDGYQNNNSLEESSINRINVDNLANTEMANPFVDEYELNGLVDLEDNCDSNRPETCIKENDILENVASSVSCIITPKIEKKIEYRSLSDSDLRKKQFKETEVSKIVERDLDTTLENEEDAFQKTESEHSSTLVKDEILRLAGQEFVLMTNRNRECDTYEGFQLNHNCDLDSEKRDIYSQMSPDNNLYHGSYKSNTYCLNTHTNSYKDSDEIYSDILSQLKKSNEEGPKITTWQILPHGSDCYSDCESISEKDSLDVKFDEDSEDEFYIFQPSAAYDDKIPFETETFNCPLKDFSTEDARYSFSSSSSSYNYGEEQRSMNENPIISQESLSADSPQTFISSKEETYNGYKPSRIPLLKSRRNRIYKSNTLPPLFTEPKTKTKKENGKQSNKKKSDFSQYSKNLKNDYFTHFPNIENSYEESDFDWDLSDYDTFEKKKTVFTRSSKTVYNKYYEEVEYSQESNEFQTIKTSVSNLPLPHADFFKEKEFKLPKIQSKHVPIDQKVHRKKMMDFEKLPILRNFEDCKWCFPHIVRHVITTVLPKRFSIEDAEKYNPYLSAERQMLELFGTDDGKGNSSLPEIHHSSPIQSSPISAFVKYSSPKRSPSIECLKSDNKENNNLNPDVIDFPPIGDKIDNRKNFSLSNLSLCSVVSIDSVDCNKNSFNSKLSDSHLDDFQRSFSAIESKSNRTVIKPKVNLQQMLYGSHTISPEQTAQREGNNSDTDNLEACEAELLISMLEFEKMLKSSPPSSPETSPNLCSSSSQKEKETDEDVENRNHKFLNNSIDSAYSSLTRSSGAEGDTGKAEMSKFCHECGAKYPIAGAKFCCNCGMRRITL